MGIRSNWLRAKGNGHGTSGNSWWFNWTSVLESEIIFKHFVAIGKRFCSGIQTYNTNVSNISYISGVYIYIIMYILYISCIYINMYILYKISWSHVYLVVVRRACWVWQHDSVIKLHWMDNAVTSEEGQDVSRHCTRASHIPTGGSTVSTRGRHQLRRCLWFLHRNTT